jgi:hypothetical protein
MVSRVKDVVTQLKDWQPANELITAGAGVLKSALMKTVLGSAAEAVKVDQKIK